MLPVPSSPPPGLRGKHSSAPPPRTAEDVDFPHAKTRDEEQSRRLRRMRRRSLAGGEERIPYQPLFTGSALDTPPPSSHSSEDEYAYSSDDDLDSDLLAALGPDPLAASQTSSTFSSTIFYESSSGLPTSEAFLPTGLLSPLGPPPTFFPPPPGLFPHPPHHSSFSPPDPSHATLGWLPDGPPPELPPFGLFPQEQYPQPTAEPHILLADVPSPDSVAPCTVWDCPRPQFCELSPCGCFPCKEHLGTIIRGVITVTESSTVAQQTTKTIKRKKGGILKKVTERDEEIEIAKEASSHSSSDESPPKSSVGGVTKHYECVSCGHRSVTHETNPMTACDPFSDVAFDTPDTPKRARTSHSRSNESFSSTAPSSPSMTRASFTSLFTTISGKSSASSLYSRSSSSKLAPELDRIKQGLGTFSVHFLPSATARFQPLPPPNEVPRFIGAIEGQEENLISPHQLGTAPLRNPHFRQRAPLLRARSLPASPQFRDRSNRSLEPPAFPGPISQFDRGHLPIEPPAPFLPLPPPEQQRPYLLLPAHAWPLPPPTPRAVHDRLPQEAHHHLPLQRASFNQLALPRPIQPPLRHAQSIPAAPFAREPSSNEQPMMSQIKLTTIETSVQGQPSPSTDLVRGSLSHSVSFPGRGGFHFDRPHKNNQSSSEIVTVSTATRLIPRSPFPTAKVNEGAMADAMPKPWEVIDIDAPIREPFWFVPEGEMLRFPLVKIENIPFGTTTQDIAAWLPAGCLADEGEVPSPIHFILHRVSGRTLPHCYVELVSKKAAHYVLQADATRLGDRTLRLKFARNGELLRDLFCQDEYFRDPDMTPASSPLPSAPYRFRLPPELLEPWEYDVIGRYARTLPPFIDRPMERPILNIVTLLMKWPWSKGSAYTKEDRDAMFECAVEGIEIALMHARKIPAAAPLARKLGAAALAVPVFSREQYRIIRSYQTHVMLDEDEATLPPDPHSPLPKHLVTTPLRSDFTPSPRLGHISPEGAMRMPGTHSHALAHRSALTREERRALAVEQPTPGLGLLDMVGGDSTADEADVEDVDSSPPKAPRLAPRASVRSVGSEDEEASIVSELRMDVN